MEGLGTFGDLHGTDSQLVVTEAVKDVMLGLVPWLRSGLPVLLVGPEGCGKACLLQHCFKQLPVRLHHHYNAAPLNLFMRVVGTVLHQ